MDLYIGMSRHAVVNEGVVSDPDDHKHTRCSEWKGLGLMFYSRDTYATAAPDMMAMVMGNGNQVSATAKEAGEIWPQLRGKKQFLELCNGKDLEPTMIYASCNA